MKWKIAFFVQLALTVCALIGWSFSDRREARCNEVLTKTVDFCGEAWLRDPLDDIETAYFIMGKQ